jgi:hypothetical protein
MNQEKNNMRQIMKKGIFLLAPLILVLLGIPGIVLAQNTTTSGNTPWKEFGVFLGPIQKHTGVFHIEMESLCLGRRYVPQDKPICWSRVDLSSIRTAH